MYHRCHFYLSSTKKYNEHLGHQCFSFISCCKLFTLSDEPQDYILFSYIMLCFMRSAYWSDDENISHQCFLLSHKFFGFRKHHLALSSSARKRMENFRCAAIQRPQCLFRRFKIRKDYIDCNFGLMLTRTFISAYESGILLSSSNTNAFLAKRVLFCIHHQHHFSRSYMLSYKPLF